MKGRFLLRSTGTALVALTLGCHGRPAGTESRVPTVPTQPPEPSPTSGVRISGSIRDVTSNLAVSGALISIGEATGETDAGGRYALTVSENGVYEPLINGVHVGTFRVTGTATRGDFLAPSTSCVARYGSITDGQTHAPVAGATVFVVGRTAVTGSDGWYRIDIGCPAGGTFGFNTTFLTVSHGEYAEKSIVVGRGVASVLRLDLELQPR